MAAGVQARESGLGRIKYMTVMPIVSRWNGRVFLTKGYFGNIDIRRHLKN